MLLGTLLAMTAAIVLSVLSFRAAGWTLAAIPAAMGCLRLMADPWGATVRNRGRGFDTALLFIAAGLLALLTATVPD